MNKPILAQDLDNANDDQWWIDRDARTELEKALGVQKNFEKTSWNVSEIFEDLRLNKDKYLIINRFEDSLRKMIQAKEKL